MKKIIKMESKKLKKIKAIALSRKIGENFIKQGYGPEIVEKYRRGAFAREISKEFTRSLEVENGIATAAIFYVLKRLLDKEEKRKLGLEHKIKNSRKNIEKINKEKKSWVYNPKIREGIFKKLTIAAGKNPWSEEERNNLAEMVLSEDYKKSGKPYPDYQEIADRLNKKYHSGKKIRNREKVKTYVRFMRRKRIL